MPFNSRGRSFDAGVSDGGHHLVFGKEVGDEDGQQQKDVARHDHRPVEGTLADLEHGEAHRQGAQGLGQKNTVLAIWVATSYVSALASLAPAAYILWQNIFNSWQLYRKTRREAAMR